MRWAGEMQLENGILDRGGAVFGRDMKGARLIGEKAPRLVLPETLRSSD
jgi:hypothetical protein